MGKTNILSKRKKFIKYAETLFYVLFSNNKGKKNKINFKFHKMPFTNIQKGYVISTQN